MQFAAAEPFLNRTRLRLRFRVVGNEEVIWDLFDSWSRNGVRGSAPGVGTGSRLLRKAEVLLGTCRSPPDDGLMPRERNSALNRCLREPRPCAASS